MDDVHDLIGQLDDLTIEEGDLPHELLEKLKKTVEDYYDVERDEKGLYKKKDWKHPYSSFQIPKYFLYCNFKVSSF